MVEIINAKQALKLAEPTEQEGLDRYKQIVAEVIIESAMGMLKSVTIAVPEQYVDNILAWLSNYAYSVSTELDDSAYWAIVKINWSEPNV